MATHRAALIATLEQYRTRYAEEAAFVAPFLHLLQAPRAYHRDHLPGHITGSAWIVNTARTHVLLTHHAKLNRWLQPGGHADGDENILNVSLREAMEETGLQHFSVLLPTCFDLDIHTIPARPDFPAHDHYDVRFLLCADDQEPLQITEESHDLAWVRLDDLADKTGHNVSMLRMAEKVKALL